MSCFFVVFYFSFLLKYGDVEICPGLKKKETSFHINLSLLEAYNTIHQYDILYKSYLNLFVVLSLFFLFQIIILFDQIILTMLKRGVVVRII